MSVKQIIFSVILACLLLILYNNRGEITIWFFTELKLSKLVLIGGVYTFGLISYPLLFKKKRKKEEHVYRMKNEDDEFLADLDEQDDEPETFEDKLSDEDREFLKKDF